jgi:hypothetical protein
MYQSLSFRVNLNPRVGLWVTLLSTVDSSLCTLSTAHVITLLSAVRSYPNNNVASRQKACHWCAQYICLVGIRIWCRCVTGRSPFTSCAHLEATVVQEQHRCFNYYNCVRHCGRQPSFFSVVTRSNEKKKVLTSLAFCLKRRISIFRKLQRLSRGRVALSKGDIPKVREGGPGVAAYFIVRGRLAISLAVHLLCVACTRIRDAGIFACLSGCFRVLTQGRRQGRMG